MLGLLLLWRWEQRCGAEGKVFRDKVAEVLPL